MKIEQPEKNYAPVIITLDTKAEAEAIRNALGQHIYDGYEGWELLENLKDFLDRALGEAPQLYDYDTVKEKVIKDSIRKCEEAVRRNPISEAILDRFIEAMRS